MESLVFHHVYERTKIDTISNLRKKGILYVLNELTKCVPLCISCHNRFTHINEDEAKIKSISRIKEWHSRFNRPGYLFGDSFNKIITAAIIHKEFVEKKTEWTKRKEQEYFKAIKDMHNMQDLIFHSNSD